MITLDMNKKADRVRIADNAFTLEDGVLTLQISLGSYSLTGKTVTAAFSPNLVETGVLVVTDGVIAIPISPSLVSAGNNHIQLNIRTATTLEQSPIMLWQVGKSILATNSATEDPDLIGSILADIIAVEAGKVDKVVGKELSTNDFTDLLETKLNGVEAGANLYVHPTNHPPAIISQDASNRFVTDTEKSTWNGKQDALGFTAENVANKKTTLTDNSDTYYPSQKAVKTAVDALETKSMFTNASLIIPTDFTPTIPFNLIFDKDLNVTHDWDLTQWKTGADTIIYVNKNTGNDSTGTGTLALPFKTVLTAWTYILTLTWTKAVINIVGSFKRTESPNGWTIPANKTLCIVGDGTPVFYSDKANALTWTADGTSYKATRTSCMNVLDLTVTADTNGFFPTLKNAVSVADCQATVNSWFTDGSYVWIHTFDSRQPDINVELNVYNLSLEFTLSDNSIVYLEGFTKHGNISVKGSTGKGMFIRNKVNSYGGGGTQSNGLDVDDIDGVYSFDCITAYNVDDGLNYHYANTANTISRLVFESNCTSYGNGLDTGDQATACHEGVSVVRINGNYTGKSGAALTDVGGCDTVILGCNLISTVGEAVNVYGAGHRLTMINSKAYTQSPYESIKADYARLRNNIVNQNVSITTMELI